MTFDKLNCFGPNVYSGVCVSSISWWRRGAHVALGGAGRVSARGAELRLAPALPPDAGHYACAVAAPAGPAARRDIDIQVRSQYTMYTSAIHSVMTYIFYFFIVMV